MKGLDLAKIIRATLSLSHSLQGMLKIKLLFGSFDYDCTCGGGFQVILLHRSQG